MSDYEKSSIDEMRKILKALAKGYKIPKEIYDIIFKVAVKEIEEKERVVLVKRDPNIETSRIQGVYVKIVDGNTLRIHPASVGGFGADFDGDSVQVVGIIRLIDDNGNDIYYRFRQEDFINLVSCKKIEEKTKSNGVKVEVYKLLKPAYILAINNSTGEIEEREVTEWHIHKNLKMYKVQRKAKNTQTFNLRELWVSDNHSLVAYNKKDKKVDKYCPEDIIKNKEDYFLIRNVDNCSKIEKYKFSECLKNFVVNKNIHMDDIQLVYKDKWDSINDNEFGYVLGTYLGDGYITYSGTHKKDSKKYYNIFALSNSCNQILDKWESVAECLTENKIVKKYDAKTKYPNKFDFKKKDGSKCKIALRSKIHDSNFCRIIMKSFSKGASNKKLPNWILHTTDEFLTSLISGYFDTDGTITSSNYMSFTSKSKYLIEDLSYILKQRFDVDSSIYEDTKKTYLTEDGNEIKTDDESKWRKYYILNICINSGSKKFFKEVYNNIVNPEKIEKLNKILENTLDTDEFRKSNISFVPYSLIEKLSPKDRKEKLDITNDNTFKIKKSEYTQKQIIIPEDIIDSSDLNDVTKLLLKKQNNGEIEFIPCEYLDIEYDPEMTEGYDFTVKDYKTFATADGVFMYDTMSIVAMLSEEANAEIKQKMIIPTTSRSINSPNFELSKEMLMGIYTMTLIENIKLPLKELIDAEDAKKLHIGNPVKFRYRGQNIVTTAGRVIFNNALPSYIPFVNEPVNKKKVNALLSQIMSENKNHFMTAVDNLSKLGFKYATLYPTTISLDMFVLPKEFEVLKERLRNEKDMSKQQDIIKEMEDRLIVFLKETNPDLYITMMSGAAKGTGQLRQVLVSKGLISDPSGKTLPPVINSFGTGFAPKEYFNASAGSRTGIISRAIMTSKGGYAYRKAVYLVGSAEADIANPDCGTKKGMKIKLTKELFSRMNGRYVFDDKGKTIPIDSKMIGKVIELRSPMYCKSLKICRLCYGDLIKQINTPNVGLVSAARCLSLSEKIMKCSNGLIEDEDGKIHTLNDIWENNK